MKKLFLSILISILSFNLTLRADEGMWIPMLVDRLNYADMQKLGLQLTAEEIYSINQSSLKDAIVQFGRGCTGEIISNQGLLITNHHCGYGQIQYHSSIEHDYLTDGFWAMSLEEELPNQGLTVRFLVRMEDVTGEMKKNFTDDMTEDQRNAKIIEVSKQLSDKAIEGTHYTAQVGTFFGGNAFYLFVYETFLDVRLVGAPPSSVGNFGDDTDNWMWPRHTGDFSMFRVYSGPDGKPAEYSKNNIPLKPKHYLPVSLDGYQEGDFSLIMGYPGRTNRYLPSYGVEMAINKSNPSIVKIRREKLDIIREVTAVNDEVRIQYASKDARISNYWKYYIGQTKGLKRLDVYSQKVAQENDFRKWTAANPEIDKKYGQALPMIENAYSILNQYAIATTYYREAIFTGPEILGYAAGYKGLAEELAKDDPDKEKVKTMVDKLKGQVDGYFKDYYLPVDQKMFSAMLQMFAQDVPADQQPEFLAETLKKYKGDYNAYAAAVFEKSVFATKEDVLAFLEKPSLKIILKDPAYQAYLAFGKKYTELDKASSEANAKLAKGNRLYIAGLLEMNPDKKYAPDANSTMRLTYGTVGGYHPADAVYYDYYTTLDGVMAKEDPSNYEFVVSDKLKKLYQAKDYGRYADNGVLNTCFLTNHDITGGNSGSPVINAYGELIGLAFDGNWEAMSGDIAFEPALQRTINVDIRYVLFIIDKYAGAKNLIDEMTIIKKMTLPREQYKAESVPAPAIDSKE